MVIPFVRRSRFFRALVLTTGVFSFLVWIYIVLRIVFNRVSLAAPFIYGIPSVSFWVLGTISFAVSFLCMFVYLWLWGLSDRASAVLQGFQERQP